MRTLDETTDAEIADAIRPIFDDGLPRWIIFADEKRCTVAYNDGFLRATNSDGLFLGESDSAERLAEEIREASDQL